VVLVVAELTLEELQVQVQVDRVTLVVYQVEVHKLAVVEVVQEQQVQTHQLQIQVVQVV